MPTRYESEIIGTPVAVRFAVFVAGLVPENGFDACIATVTEPDAPMLTVPMFHVIIWVLVILGVVAEVTVNETGTISVMTTLVAEAVPVFEYEIENVTMPPGAI